MGHRGKDIQKNGVKERSLNEQVLTFLRFNCELQDESIFKQAQKFTHNTYMYVNAKIIG